jgi:O-antigen/teichoic acid export membrane protein
MSLKKEAAKGFAWVAVEYVGQQVLQAVLFIVLARLLTPEDFGLTAMLMVFFSVSQSFIDSGMGQALIRQKEITDQDRATVFWFNLLLSVLFYLLLFFTAPYIASFYKEPKLTELTRVMGLAVIFFGIGIVQRSELTQQLQFKKQAYAQIPAMLISGVISVLMAFLGYGVWALVSQYLLLALLSSIFLWILKPSKILFAWNKDSFSRLFGFGYKLLLSGLLNTVFSNVYKLVIGKFFMAATLGFYVQAKKMQELASNSLIGVIQKVTYPLLAKAGTNPERLKRGYRMVIQSSSFVIFPCLILLILLGEPVILYVLGEKWLPSVPFLQLVCISGMLLHLHAINLNVLKVLGRSDLFLKLEIIKKINITIAVIIGLQYGIYGLLISQVISSYVALFINSYYTVKFLDYSYREQGADVLKVLLLSVPMAAAVLLLQQVFSVSSLLVLLIYIFIAGFIYLAGALLFRTSVSAMIFDVLNPYLPRKIKNIFHL